MIALIDQYRKELENIRIYALDTIQVYTRYSAQLN